jgi:hypothetical protein
MACTLAASFEAASMNDGISTSLCTEVHLHAMLLLLAGLQATAARHAS